MLSVILYIVGAVLAGCMILALCDPECRRQMKAEREAKYQQDREAKARRRYVFPCVYYIDEKDE